MKLAQFVLLEERLEFETKSKELPLAAIFQSRDKPPTAHPSHDSALDSLDPLFVPCCLQHPT
jgi:hypothetical protein